MTTEFIFAPPLSQAELRARLAALEARRHASHRPGEPARACLLCPPREQARR